MGEKSDDSGADSSDVEEVPLSGESIYLSDENDDDDICEVEHLRKLFIGGLAGQTNEATLRKFYSKWGTVVDTVVMRDSDTKRSRGFGFVTYSKVSMVDKAQANRPHVIDGKTVESKRALPRPESQPPEGKKNPSVKKIFVSGIKDDHDEECLTEYFSEFGKVVSVSILTDNITGKRRGYCLIEYDDYDAVDKAILQKSHIINNILLDVKKSVYTNDPKKTPEKKRERPETTATDSDNKNNTQRGSMANRNMPPMGPPAQPYSSPYQGLYQGPHYAQPKYPQMPPYQQCPPPNYNQWGPPPEQHAPPMAQPPNPYHQQPTAPAPQQQAHGMQSQNYGGYSHAPMPPAQTRPPQAGHWNNYPQNYVGNSWNAPPPPPQPPMPVQPQAPNWQNGQWGPPPSFAGQQRPMPPANPPPPPNWQHPAAPQNVVPPQKQYPGPEMYHQTPQQQSVPPPPPLPNNFGNGYQQNYSGGPTKQSNMYSNRMNPYNSGPSNQYNNNNPTVQGYGNAIPNGNRYRR